MYIPLRVGEAISIVDPATNGPVTVIVTAIANGSVQMSWVAPPDVPVTKVRDEWPTRMH